MASLHCMTCTIILWTRHDIDMTRQYLCCIFKNTDTVTVTVEPMTLGRVSNTWCQKKTVCNSAITYHFSSLLYNSYVPANSPLQSFLKKLIKVIML